MWRWRGQGRRGRRWRGRRRRRALHVLGPQEQGLLGRQDSDGVAPVLVQGRRDRSFFAVELGPTLEATDEDTRTHRKLDANRARHPSAASALG